HAAVGLSGADSAAVQVAQPHDHTVASPSSRATVLAESASSFVSSYHLLGGRSCSRPPEPGVVWKPSMIPSLEAGIPIEMKSWAPPRNICRIVRLPWTTPSL